MAGWLSKVQGFLAVPRNRYIVLGGVAGLGLVLLGGKQVVEWAGGSDDGDLNYLFSYQQKLKMLGAFSHHEGSYTTTNLDGEYNCKHDSHGCNGYSRCCGSKVGHVGLSWGFVQFTQKGGNLGKVLARMYKKNPALFETTFNGHDCAHELLNITNAPDGGVTKPDPLSHTGQAFWPYRCEPVCGHVLWDSWWVPSFKQAGKIPEFIDAQKEQAIISYCNGSLKKTAIPLNIRSEKALTCLFDRADQNGVSGSYTKFKTVWDKLPAGMSEQDKMAAFVKYYDGAHFLHRTNEILANPNLSWKELW